MKRETGNPCFDCDCGWYDSDLGCTCSSLEKWYQCPLEPEPDWDDYDYCYECSGYGNDYYTDENGEWVSSCPGCPHNTIEGDYEDE